MMTNCPTTTDSLGSRAEDRACAFLSIDLEKIAENYKRLRRQAHGPATGAVVKADGYGLGLGQVGRTLLKAGARSFFVASLDEALALRRILDDALAGTAVYVLNGLMRGAEAEYKTHNLQPVLNSLGDLEAWQDFAKAGGTPLPAALHIDTGMNRLGLPQEELDLLADEPGRFEGVLPTLILSHLACAEEPDDPMNRMQLERFESALNRLPRAPASLANSSGCFLGHEYHFDVTRPGVALYGVNPTPGKENPMAGVVRLRAKVLQIRHVDAPDSVGYGAAHRVTGPSRIATIGIGYADGYHRALSDKGTAWLGDEEIPVVGRVSMDLTTLDVTHIRPDKIHPGALVDLLAKDDGIDRLADEAGTIGYEILTSLGKRFHRQYHRGPDS